LLNDGKMNFSNHGKGKVQKKRSTKKKGPSKRKRNNQRGVAKEKGKREKHLQEQENLVEAKKMQYLIKRGKKILFKKTPSQSNQP